MQKIKSRSDCKIDKVKALELKQVNGLNYQQIANIQGVSKQAVQQALKPLIPPRDLIKQYNEHRSEITSYIELQAANAYLTLSEHDRKELTKRRGLVDWGIASDKVQALSGSDRSTQPLVIINRLSINNNTVDQVIELEQAVNKP